MNKSKFSQKTNASVITIEAVSFVASSLNEQEKFSQETNASPSL